jgi:DNA-binding NarL/FixJ family response regulator
MTAILLADDHAAVRAGMRRLLTESLEIEHLGEAGNGTEVLERMRERPWDLLLLDISMPQRAGIDVLPQLRSSYPGTRVLVMTMYGERQYARHVLRAGADGFVSKGATAEELLDAVRTTLAGRRYVSPALADLLAADGGGDDGARLPHEALTEREMQVFRRLAEGQSQSTIANELCLAPKTISGYRARILQQFGFDSDAQLTIYAIRNGLISS